MTDHVVIGWSIDPDWLRKCRKGFIEPITERGRVKPMQYPIRKLTRWTNYTHFKTFYNLQMEARTIFRSVF